MQENRSQVIAWIGLSEGGLVNHPNGPGGLTNMGITHRTYAAWHQQQGLQPASVKSITKAEADEIVSRQYQTLVMIDQLPAGPDCLVGDCPGGRGRGAVLGNVAPEAAGGVMLAWIKVWLIAATIGAAR